MSNNERIPTISELHNRAHERLRNAWREEASPPVHEAYADRASGGPGDSGVRLDVANIPRAADLYARHAARARTAWRDNPGDGTGPVRR